MSDYRLDIWRLQAQSDIDGLIAALDDQDAGVRKRAAAALRTLGAERAVPKLREILEKETDADARAHIVAALDHLSAEKDSRLGLSDQPMLEQNRISLLIAQLGSKNPQQVITAATELGELNDKLAAEPLVMIFNNNQMPPKVRLAVAETLLKLESAPVEVSLLGALRSPNWEIRRKAAAILAQLKAEWAIEPLGKAALRDQHEKVRRTARAALKHIDTPNALSMLKAVLKAEAIRPPSANKPPAAPPKPAPPAGSKPVKPQPKPEPAAEPDDADDEEPTDPKPPAGLRGALRARLNATQTGESVQSPGASAPDTPAESVSADSDSAPKAETPPAAVTEPSEDDAEISGEGEEPKLAWPKRKPPHTMSLAPTQQLDPRVLEEMKRRLSLEKEKKNAEAAQLAEADGDEDSEVFEEIEAELEADETTAAAPAEDVEAADDVENASPEDDDEPSS